MAMPTTKKKTTAKKTAVRIGTAKKPARKTTVKSIAVKRPAISTPIYPICRKCGTTMRQPDMKFNDYDGDGNLFESYKCPRCGHMFSITYDGPNDRCSWWYDN